MSYEAHKAFRFPDDRSLAIWRYMDLPRLVSLFQQRALYFPTALELSNSDPLEGRYLNPQVERMLANLDNSFDEFPPIPPEGKTKIIAQLGEHFRTDMRHLHCVNCWHKAQNENMAMWYIYAGANKGIALKSTVDRLCGAVRDYPEAVYIGEVTYIDQAIEDIPWGNMFFPFVHKNIAYEFEHEIRAIVTPYQHKIGELESIDRRDLSTEQQAEFVGVSVPVDVHILIEEIVLAPYLEQWIEEVVRRLLELYEITAPVTRSSLEIA